MIDAGSSHSGVVLYKWPEKKIECTGVVEQVDSCSIKPGISSYLNDTESEEKAGDAILECIKQVVHKLGKGPESHIPVNLAATAGMRLAKIADPNSVKIFIVINKVLNTEPKLTVKKVDILSGQNEGLFAWVTNNFVTGHLQDEKSNNTVGMLDMGGASAQIAFLTNNTKTGKNDVNIKVFGNNHTVHTYSNLCYGMNEAEARYQMHLIISSKEHAKQIDSPCNPIGSKIVVMGDKLKNRPCLKLKSKQVTFQEEYHFNGISDPDKCAEIVSKHLTDQTDCQKTYNMCFEALDNPPPESMHFIAISNYVYSKTILQLSKPYNEKEYLDKLRKLCEMDHDNVKNSFKNAENKYINDLCFEFNYIYSTLKNIYKFSSKMWSNLEFEDEINGTELGWTMGLMINETTANCDSTKLTLTTNKLNRGPA